MWLHGKGTEGQPDLTGSLEHNRAKDTGISYKLQLNMDGRRQSTTEQNYTNQKNSGGVMDLSLSGEVQGKCGVSERLFVRT